MNILIAGAGRLGEQASHLLNAIGHRVTVIDRDARRLEALGAEHLHRVVRADASDAARLEAAGAPTADLLIAATGDDEDNLVIALLAKRQFRVARVMARVNNPDNAWLFDGRWGVDVALPRETPLVALIEEAAGATDTIGLVRLAAAGVSVIETQIAARSTSAGRSLGEVALPAGTVVAAVVREGRPTVPGPGYRFRAGDTVLVVTMRATERDIHDAFQ